MSVPSSVIFNFPLLFIRKVLGGGKQPMTDLEKSIQALVHENERLSKIILDKAVALADGSSAANAWLLETKEDRQIMVNNENEFLRLTDNISEKNNAKSNFFIAECGNRLHRYQSKVTGAMRVVSLKGSLR